MSARELVYDIGAYHGEDTAYYLHRGFRVVSVEADPHLANSVEARCSQEISDGRCTLLNIGVAEREGSAPFYLSDLPVFNSFDRAMASRPDGRVREIAVQCRSLQSLMNEYGVPYFLKLDIEGVDRQCVLSLQPGTLPVYLSFEADDDAPELVQHLASLGFTQFRLVNQLTWKPVVVPEDGLKRVAWQLRQNLRLALRRLPRLHRMLTAMKRAYLSRGTKEPTAGSQTEWQFVMGSSGPIPSLQSPGWMGAPAFTAMWQAARAGGILDSSWFDVHAARPQASEEHTN